MFRLDGHFRPNLNGLASLVQQALGLVPFAACVYLSSNHRRNRVKILGWDRNGFWRLLKRLEKPGPDTAAGRPAGGQFSGHPMNEL